MPKDSDTLQKLFNAGDVEAYIKDREEKVLGLKPELARGILWADPTVRRNTPLSIVYIHGFSASRRDISPVVEMLSSRLRANTYFARLSAHGLDDGGEAFAKVAAHEWVDDAQEALAIGKRIGDRVILIGTSTGAVLSLLAARDNAEKIAAVVLLSPNFGLRDKRAKFLGGPWGRWVAPLALGKYRSVPVESPQQERAWTMRYRSEGIGALMALTNYGSDINMNAIKAPPLFLYTSHDKLIDIGKIKKKFAESNHPKKRIVDVPDATRHELTGEMMGRNTVSFVVDEIHRFVFQVTQ